MRNTEALSTLQVLDCVSTEFCVGENINSQDQDVQIFSVDSHVACIRDATAASVEAVPEGTWSPRKPELDVISKMSESNQLEIGSTIASSSFTELNPILETIRSGSLDTLPASNASYIKSRKVALSDTVGSITDTFQMQLDLGHLESNLLSNEIPPPRPPRESLSNKTSQTDPADPLGIVRSCSSLPRYSGRVEYRPLVYNALESTSSISIPSHHTITRSREGTLKSESMGSLAARKSGGSQSSKKNLFANSTENLQNVYTKSLSRNHSSETNIDSSASGTMRRSRTFTDLRLSDQEGRSSTNSAVRVRNHLRTPFASGSNSSLSISDQQRDRASVASYPPSSSHSAASAVHASTNALQLYTKLLRVIGDSNKRQQSRLPSALGKPPESADRRRIGRSRAKSVSPQMAVRGLLGLGKRVFKMKHRSSSVSTRSSMQSSSSSGSSSSASSASGERGRAVTSSSRHTSDSEVPVNNGTVSPLALLNTSALSHIDWGQSLGDDEHLNVAILGDRNTGKTSLSTRLCNGLFDACYEPTIAELDSHVLNISGHKCSLRILDTSMREWTSDQTPHFGHTATTPRESFRASSSRVHVGMKSKSMISLHPTTTATRHTHRVPSSIDPLWWAHGYILTFAVDDQRSFKRVAALRDELIRRGRFERSAVRPPIVVVGTKVDIYHKAGSSIGVAGELPKWLGAAERLVTEQWGLQFKLVSCTSYTSNAVFHTLSELMRDYYVSLLLHEGVRYTPNYTPGNLNKQGILSEQMMPLLGG